MIDLDEIFLNMLKIFLIELKFILLYCIYRITTGHLIIISKNCDAINTVNESKILIFFRKTSF